MFTSIRRYHVTDKEELTRRAHEDFVPRVREIPGFVGYYVMHGEGDTWVSISVFETREGVEESNRVAADLIRDLGLGHLIEGEPEILVGESKVEEMAHRGLHGEHHREHHHERRHEHHEHHGRHAA